jgi:hypothetical protein
MVEKWVKRYSQAISNAEIAATASETFVVNAGNLNAHGRANGFILTNLSTENIKVETDGLATDVVVFGAGTFGIEPKDGWSFQTLKITNLDAANAIAAAELQGSIFKSDLVVV